MSHRHHPAISTEVAHVVTDLNNMNELELKELYNVEVWEDGQVRDLTENEVYPNAVEWANHYVDLDSGEYDDLIPDKYADEGDFY